MAIPASTVHVQIRGTAPQGEIFQWGFWLGSTTITSEATANALALDVWNHFVTFALGTATSLIPSTASYTEVRVYCYPTGGPTATFIGVHTPTPAPGTSAGNSLPLQCAAVVSLRTGFAGRQARGRLYLPVSANTLVTHQLTSATITNIANAWETFLEAVSTLAAVGSVSVVSQVGSGTVRPVTQLIVDSRLDIQRRRANGEQVLFTQVRVVTP